MKKVAIVWPGFTGYMAGPWHALAKRVQLKVFIEPSRMFEQAFKGDDLAGLDWKRVEGDAGFASAIAEIEAFRPDLGLTAGWSTPLVRKVGKTDFGCRKAIAFDMPWEWRLRQIAARWVLRPYLRNFDATFVPGKRAARYARWLGFKNIETGCNPSGWERFSVKVGCGARRFLFSGRFSPETGLDFLFAAYAKYRGAVGDPWPLDLVGIGECLPAQPEGVSVVGFVEPRDMPKTVSGYAALLLVSNWETWGISAMEAMSAGLSVIATDACGFTSDIEPTMLVNSGDVDGLAAAMRRVHEMDDAQRAAEGVRLQNEAKRYSDFAWVERFLRLMGEKGKGEE